MTNINRIFKCIACFTEFPVSITTDLEISDFTIIAKCPKCGNSIQIHFGVIEQTQTNTQQQTTSPNLDDSIFIAPEMPSDEIKQLIEE